MLGPSSDAVDLVSLAGNASGTMFVKKDAYTEDIVTEMMRQTVLAVKETVYSVKNTTTIFEIGILLWGESNGKLSLRTCPG